MANEEMTNLKVYELAEKLGDDIWALVEDWDKGPQDTVGAPLVKAADSVGASIAEGSGRGDSRYQKYQSSM